MGLFPKWGRQLFRFFVSTEMYIFSVYKLQDMSAFQQEISALHVVLAPWVGYFPVLSIRSLSIMDYVIIKNEYIPTLILHELLKSAGAVQDTVPSGLTSTLVSANKSLANILVSTLKKKKERNFHTNIGVLQREG